MPDRLAPAERLSTDRSCRCHRVRGASVGSVSELLVDVIGTSRERMYRIVTTNLFWLFALP